MTGEKVTKFPDVDLVMVFQAVSECKLSHWPLDLYQVVIEMTNSGIYKAAMVQLLIWQTNIGTIRRVLNYPTSIEGVPYTNSSIGGRTPTNSTLNSTLTAVSGQITDPTHPFFEINRRIAGKRISAAEIWSAQVDIRVLSGVSRPQ